MTEDKKEEEEPEEEIPAVIYKCGCMWGGGSRTKEPHFIKRCWKHGG